MKEEILSFRLDMVKNFFNNTPFEGASSYLLLCWRSVIDMGERNFYAKSPANAVPTIVAFSVLRNSQYMPSLSFKYFFT
jgi:hypothetical protein